MLLQLTLTLNANAAAKEMLPLTLTPKLKKLLLSHSRAVQLLKCWSCSGRESSGAAVVVAAFEHIAGGRR
jgi:hypothetical protein